MFDFACNGMGFGHGGSLLLNVFFWLLIVVVAVWVVAWLLPRLRTTSPTSRSALGPSSDTAIEILKRRYASGEISKAEYEAMRTDIEA